MKDLTSKHHKPLPRAIWALGLVSFFMDLSSEIIHGLLPVYLVSVLGASLTTMGMLEGVAEAVVLCFKVISGPLSDWLGKRKPLVLFGYGIAAFTKPLFALASSVPLIAGARILDRVGKGIRGAPRDALIADIVSPDQRGSAFGLRQSLDTLGAFLGPILAIGLMSLFSDNFKWVFWMASIPAILCVLTLQFGVEEPDNDRARSSKPEFNRDLLRRFSSRFWFVVVAGGVFQLVRMSEAFLILRARDFGLTLAMAPLVLIVMNAVYFLAAYPLGRLSDRIPRVWFLCAGLVVLLFSQWLLAMGDSLNGILGGVALWGLHLGLTQGTLTAMVVDECPDSFRGTAFGIFNIASAIALLAASLIAGSLWDAFGARATFFCGMAISGVSLLVFGVKGFKDARRLH